MVAHPVSDHTQPCLTSVKLMELAEPLGHSPRNVDTRAVEWLLQKREGKGILQKIGCHEPRTEFSKAKGGSDITHDSVINVQHAL